MLKIFYILPFFFLIDAGDNQTNSLRKLQPRIWGGTSTNRTHFPFYVGLKSRYKGNCGGTLISKYFVLTAAHCIAILDLDKYIYGILDWVPTILVEVYFGMSKYYSVENDTDSYIMTVNETGQILHPLYSHNSSTLFNDIALIKLPRAATLTPYVQLAYLPFKNETRDFTVGQQLFSSGWGRLGDDKKKKPTKLQYIETQIVPENDCIHPTIIRFNNDLNICINAANRSLCRGDSGGPNVIFTPDGAILIGISSDLTIPSSEGEDFNKTCEAGLPQVLTRVSYYLDWIHNHTGIQPVN